MLPEMMTLQEVADYFRVEKRVLRRYGLERLGGVRLGPRSWRFPRNEVLKHGVQKPEQKQGQVPMDGSTVHWEYQTEEVLRDEKGGVVVGVGKIPVIRRGRPKDPYGLLD
ncbi:MAG: helix-turn-helix domain-containing protein [Desulfobulbus sp.]|nr:helix-turn-helix domain-containing protein [Desulfobulbus sp.]